MKKVLVQNTDNQILRRLFRKGEISYTVSDLSKAVGPMIDLMFVALFIGPDGEKEISLSIIMKMAKDVKYTTAFGANNLIVRI